MLKCTHADCNHSWMQVLLPTLTVVDTCPVCEEEAEMDEEIKTNAVSQQNEDKARYYNRTYGDEI